MAAVEYVLPRGRGRPRDVEKDVAIREAAWRVLADLGYDRLTFETVAEVAGCSRATLYRRFSSKVELIAAILDQTSRALEPELAQDVSPRDALIAHAQACMAFTSGDRGQAVMSLGFVSKRTPELTTAIAAYSFQEREYYRREFLKIHRNATPEDVEFACDTLIGSVTYHVAVLQHPLNVARIGQLVDQAIGILR